MFGRRGKTGSGAGLMTLVPAREGALLRLSIATPRPSPTALRLIADAYPMFKPMRERSTTTTRKETVS
jgi:hypothetical protein